jgi:hypothetical protein
MTLSSLLPETRAIIEELEQRSGYPVSWFEDPTLSVLATVRTGTPGRPIHVIRYKPGAARPDYPIAFEAGLAIRMFQHPPEQRFHLSGDTTKLDEIATEIRKRHPAMAPDVVRALSRQLFDGLMLQLRSCAPGILVDTWIFEGFPGLRAAQAASVAQQLATNVQSLSPEHARQFPTLIVKANRAMNAAYAIALGRLLGQPQHLIPYRAAGLEAIGLELLADLAASGRGGIDDRALITAWAKRLGVERWLAWLPFD